jgi:hypothetical protein
MVANNDILEDKFVNVAGVRLHHQEVGSGPQSICIHGATRRGHWAQVDHAAAFNRLVLNFLSH